jgi:tetratricopeptide (TPR) repeat protein
MTTNPTAEPGRPMFWSTRRKGGVVVTSILCAGVMLSGAPSIAASSKTAKSGKTKPSTTVAGKRSVTAVRLAEANVAKARSGGDQQALANALKDLGYQHLLTKNFPSAVSTLKEAAALYRKLKDDSNLASTLQLQGWASLQANNAQEALAPLVETVALRRKLQGQTGGNLALVEALQFLSQAQRGTGKGADAIKTLEEILALAASGTKGIDTATIAISIGSIYMEQKNPTAAVKYFEQAVAGTEGKSARQIEALQALGWSLTESKRAPEAVAALQKAIKLAGPSIERTKLGVDLHLLLANAAREAKQSTLEIDTRNRLVAYARAGVPGITLEDALDGLGLTLIFEDRFSDAIPPLKELVTLARKGPVSTRLGTGLHNLGWALSSARQYPEAIANLEEAVEVRTKLNDPELLVSLRFLGYAMWSTKDPRATAAFTKALELVKQKPNATDADLAQGYLDVSSSKLFEGDYDGAVQPARTAVDLYAKANGTDEQIANSNFNLGWALFSSGKPSEAVPFLTRARDIRTKNNLDGAEAAASMLAAAIAQTKA